MSNNTHIIMHYLPMRDWDVESMTPILRYLISFMKDKGVKVGYDNMGIFLEVACSDGCFPSDEQSSIIKRIEEIHEQVGQVLCKETEVI